MFGLIKKYWDIFGGITIGILMAFFAEFQLEKLQICYSAIILILVSIGFFRIIKQAVEKKVEKSREKKRQTVIDTIVDGQTSVKAVRMAQNPTKDGEVLGRATIKLWEGLKRIMKNFFNKVKVFFDKFKGILLSCALMVLTLVEDYGGYINKLFGGEFEVGGYEIIPIVTLISAVVVGIISDGWTKDQKEKIKALFSKSSTDEIVHAEIKKTLKEHETKVKEFNKVLSAKNLELDNLTTELETKKNTHSAKVEMARMIPRLATDEDVQLAYIAVKEVENKITVKKKEIAEVESTLANLTSTITALKSQL